MSLPIYRLRRWLATTAILFTAIVGGMYFYARMRQLNKLRELPGKMGFDIKQTATGFEFSKSDGKRTLFTIRATDLKQFKLNGHAELHNVSILLYGRDSSRFDQIYGDDFAYDPKSGNVTAQGEVQIDLEANPSGHSSPDQTTPKALKNPIHLKTRDLVFNNQTGDATTDARVEFQTPEANGWAVGIEYKGKSNALTLVSQLHVAITAAADNGHVSEIQADHGVITSQPRQITLAHPSMRRNDGNLRADFAIFFLDAENNVDRILAEGNVGAETGGQPKRSGEKALSPPSKSTATDSAGKKEDEVAEMRARADSVELLLAGKKNLLRTATLTGNVEVNRTGIQPLQGKAGRVILAFAGQNEIKNVHAAEGVRLTQRSTPPEQTGSNQSLSDQSHAESKANARAQDFELTAPIIDFKVASGRFLQTAVTSGTAEIKILPAPSAVGSQSSASQQTVITAGKFNADFEPTGQGNGNKPASRLTQVHGAPDARIVSRNPGESDRVSTSQSVDAVFLPHGGIDSIVQEGNVVFTDGLPPEKRTQAWADRARYTPSDQVLILTGNPRVVAGSMATTANTIRINRAIGDATADGDVKSTYSELKEQPNGALLASSSPIHVTAQTMVAHHGSNIALYSGKARLWQDANIIEAPSIEFDRERRIVTAQGTNQQPVSTILIQSERTPTPGTGGSFGKAAAPEAASSNTHSGKQKTETSSMSRPVSITAARLTYSDSDRKAHYEGKVQVRGADFTASANSIDAYFLPRSQTATTQASTLKSSSASATGQLSRMVAQGDVVIQQPTRRATAQQLVYTSADDKFVLTGGPPSIFDAEQGKITGVSLTFFRANDRVLVEGEANTPVVTRTKVAR